MQPLVVSRPGHSFSYYKEPAKPDYSDTSNWAALPTKIDSADAVPINSAEMDGQSTARVDVFYIHPTVNFSARSWNADLANEKLNKRTDEYPIRMQAVHSMDPVKFMRPLPSGNIILIHRKENR
ncbi:MAG: DUF3089 domain-containing protein [Bacteroidetes bacterium]|nr:DUF3089 domain-containing protein [Bacteroidota bacterium]